MSIFLKTSLNNDMIKKYHHVAIKYFAVNGTDLYILCNNVDLDLVDMSDATIVSPHQYEELYRNMDNEIEELDIQFE